MCTSPVLGMSGASLGHCLKMAPLMGGENDRPNITGTFGRYSRIACSYRGLMAAVDRGAVALAVITEIRCFGESVDVLRTASVAVRVVTRGNRTGCDQS